MWGLYHWQNKIWARRKHPPGQSIQAVDDVVQRWLDTNSMLSLTKKESVLATPEQFRLCGYGVMENGLCQGINNYIAPSGHSFQADVCFWLPKDPFLDWWPVISTSRIFQGSLSYFTPVHSLFPDQRGPASDGINGLETRQVFSVTKVDFCRKIIRAAVLTSRPGEQVILRVSYWNWLLTGNPDIPEGWKKVSFQAFVVLMVLSK